MKRLLLACLLPLSLTGCVDRAVTAVTPEQTATENLEFNVDLNPNLDILFVVDNSNSMIREQEQLIANFPRMIEVLETLPTGLPNLHIGVITTDAGGCGADTGGGLLQVSGAGACTPLDGATERYLIDVDDGTNTGTRDRNYDGTLTEAFQCVANQGVGGCGFEEPLQAIEQALTRAENSGFIRPDSLLAIVLLTDEDDCSAADELFIEDNDLGPRTSLRCFAHGIECNPDLPATTLGERLACAVREDDEFMTPIDTTVALLRELRPLQSKLIVAGIMGELPTEDRKLQIGNILNSRGETDVAVMPSCDLGGRCGDDECNVAEDATSCPADCDGDVAQGEGAFPPVRNAAFLAQFEHNVYETICAADLSPAIEKIGAEIVKQIYGACIEGDLADANPELDGTQADCSLTEVQHPLTEDEVKTILPQCLGADPDSATNQPCWTIEVDDRCLNSEHQLRITTHYPDAEERDPDTIIQAQCMTE